MRVARLHTQAGIDPLKGAAMRPYMDADGLEFSVPAHWGQSAAEVLVQDVFCRRPVPALLKPVPEDGVPAFLWRHVPDEEGLDGISAEWRLRYERDTAEVLARIAGGLAYHGWKAGLFTSEDDARAFHDELRWHILYQAASPEVALLASAGLDWAYGFDVNFIPSSRVTGFSDALFAGDIAGAGVAVSPDAPEKNILKRLKLLGEKQALDDDRRGISVTLPVENIDSLDFINLKREADTRTAAIDLGQRMLEQALERVMDACERDSVFGFDEDRNLKLRQAMVEARRAGVGEGALRRAVQYAQQGFENPDLGTRGEEVLPPPLQCSLSVPDEFIESALTGHGFLLKEAGEAARHVSAEKIWNATAAAIWSAGEPAILFRDSTAAAGVVGRTHDIAPSGTGGAIFLPGSMVPAASINLQKMLHAAKACDSARLEHAVRIMTVALESSLSMVRVAGVTQEYRPISIGVSGIPALLMANALPYDSEAGRATAALVTALASAAAQETSALIAQGTGAFPGYAALEKEYLQQLKDNISALNGTSHLQKGLSRRPAELKSGLCPDVTLPEAVKAAYNRAYAAGREKGFRHAHLTAIDTAPALQAMLGMQARDIAPFQALVRFEGHYEGGAASGIYGKKLNPAVPHALARMGFTPRQIDDITFYAAGHGTLLDAPAISHAALKAKGFHQAALDALESALATAQHIRYVFNRWTLGEDFCRHMLGFSEEELSSGTFDMLSALGFSEDNIDRANLYCCGAMTLEGAPHIKPAQLGIFDCAAPAGAGVRRVAAEAQIKMQAAVEPFLSGCAAHTVELGHYASIDDIQELLLLGWELGVKRIRLYRDGCFLAEPLAAVQGAGDSIDEASEGLLKPRKQMSLL